MRKGPSSGGAARATGSPGDHGRRQGEGDARPKQDESEEGQRWRDDVHGELS